jgi:hypothetical protein
LKKLTILNNFVNNKGILFFFTFTYVVFSIYTINQYSIALSNVDFYEYFFGDGALHISYINSIDVNLNLKKIHYHPLYNNNYYIFSVAILKLLKIFPGADYTLVGISAVIINLISTYVICITCYLISYNLSKSKFFSLAIVLLLWNNELLFFSFSIYPEVLQLAFIFLAVYFVTLTNESKWFFVFLFCGFAFGVKALGLLIFIYLILFYFIHEFYRNFKTLNRKIFIRILLCTFFYSLLFLIVFFALNQLNPFNFFKSLLSASIMPGTEIKEFDIDNSKIVYKYFIYLFRKKTIFIIFLTAIFLNFFFLVYKKKVDVFFYVTLIFLALFYYQTTNHNKLVEGPRYLFHLLPCVIILISLTYNNLREYFNEKKLKIIPLLFIFVVFSQGVIIFKDTFLNIIPRLDYKTKIKKDDMIDGYNFFKENITTNKKDPLVCAGISSVIPMNFSKNIKKSYTVEDDIRNENCEFIILDFYNPGRYIWFNENLDNLLIRQYDSLDPFVKRQGKEIIKKNQELIKYLLEDPMSEYIVRYYNSKIIILSKK